VKEKKKKGFISKIAGEGVPSDYLSCVTQKKNRGKPMSNGKKKKKRGIHREGEKREKGATLWNYFVFCVSLADTGKRGKERHGLRHRKREKSGFSKGGKRGATPGHYKRREYPLQRDTEHMYSQGKGDV